MDESTTRRRRVAVTRDAVRDVALTLFAERGYQGTALSQIAQELGISTPGLYNHMTSKQALLTEIVLATTQQVWRDYESAVAEVGEGVEERMRAAVRIYALRHATHRREALIVNRDSASVDPEAWSEIRSLRRLHERAVRALVEEGTTTGVFVEQPAALVSFAVLEMCVSIARWFRDDGEYDASAVADQYSEYAVRMARGESLWSVAG